MIGRSVKDPAKVSLRSLPKSFHRSGILLVACAHSWRASGTPAHKFPPRIPFPGHANRPTSTRTGLASSHHVKSRLESQRSAERNFYAQGLRRSVTACLSTPPLSPRSAAKGGMPPPHHETLERVSCTTRASLMVEACRPSHFSLEAPACLPTEARTAVHMPCTCAWL